MDQLAELRAKEERLVARARQLLDKEEELVSLERQLLAKQDALYWRKQCLRSEHEATPPAMPPLIQIQAQPQGIVGVEPREIERRRVTLAYQPDRQHQLQRNPETSVKQVLTAATVYNITYLFNEGAARDDMTPPTAVRLTADLCPSTFGSTVRTSLVAGQLRMQLCHAASVL